MAAKPKTIDEYLAAVTADQRVVLEKLRQTIRALVPKAQEYINYGVAAFQLDGKALAGFGAGKNHCSYFPMSGTTVATLKNDLKDYDTSKGTIRFTVDKPLPVALVRKLIKTRIAEMQQQRKAKKGGTASKQGSTATLEQEVETVLAFLKRSATKKDRDAMARYGIPSDKALGVSVGTLQKYSKRLGHNHDLAVALWDTDVYEARMLAAFVGEPERVTPAQMDRWCKNFDNWAVCDHMCFHLFDRTPHAWSKVATWSGRNEEFVKRAAFALLWGLTVHDKQSDDKPFVEALLLVERAATDERHLVKKAVNMALRAVGKRNLALNTAAVETAQRLGASPNAAAQWVGKDALRELTSSAVTKRLAGRSRS